MTRERFSFFLRQISPWDVSQFVQLLCENEKWRRASNNSVYVKNVQPLIIFFSKKFSVLNFVKQFFNILAIKSASFLHQKTFQSKYLIQQTKLFGMINNLSNFRGHVMKKQRTNIFSSKGTSAGLLDQKSTTSSFFMTIWGF